MLKIDSELLASHWFRQNKIIGNSINPFVRNAPFLYPLKTSKNLEVFLCFQGVEKECIGSERVKYQVMVLNKQSNKE